MKKILLIEDVIYRQEDFMSHMDFTLKDYSDILDNAIESKYISIAESLKNDTFCFDDYDMIISHKTAFGDQPNLIINKLELYCKSTQKPLVLFSGGISNYYKNIDFEYLELNSKDFYSQNLKLFLDAYKKGNQNLLILSYGDKWILNILLNILERINLFINKDPGDDIVYDTFRNFTKINRLEKIDHTFYSMKTEEGWVYLSEIVEMKDSIANYIKKISYA